MSINEHVKRFNMNGYGKCKNIGYLSTDDRLKGNDSSYNFKIDFGGYKMVVTGKDLNFHVLHKILQGQTDDTAV